MPPPHVLAEEIQILFQQETMWEPSQIQDPRILFLLLFSFKEERWTKTNIGPKKCQLFYRNIEIQNGDTVCNTLLKRGDWFTVVDLDIYFHIPIWQKQCFFFHFVTSNDIYEYKALLFGLSTALSVLTKYMTPVATCLRLRGISVLLYVNDSSVVADSEMSVAEFVSFTLLLDLGLWVNLKKSHLTWVIQYITWKWQELTCHKK